MITKLVEGNFITCMQVLKVFQKYMVKKKLTFCAKVASDIANARIEFENGCIANLTFIVIQSPILTVSFTVI